MKKAFFTLILLAVAAFASAQSLQFEWEGNVIQDGQVLISPFNEAWGEYVLELKIRNLTVDDMNVIVQREIVETADGALVYFCWGLCLSPDANISPEVPVPAMALSDEEFASHVMFTEGETGVVKIKYFAYDAQNPENRVCFTVLAGATAEASEHTFNLGQAYPNPASSQVHFDYNCDGGSNINAVVYNLLGQEVKVQHVSGSHGRINIAVDDLQPGIYFCSIQVDEAIVKTEKFIVKR